ncbi:MAG: NfeD family protein [Hyphomicrobiaceae bacterium]|nr:NfeD family protein [Hyphomicrobiaceae bacterium]
MRRRLARRLWASDGDPGPLAWTLATVSLVLPVVGVILVLAGGAGVMRGEADGWQLLGVGALAIVLDILIDFVWAHPGVSATDQPDLNRRSAQLAGRILVVADPIVAGRGKVRVGDTLWIAEGPDLPAGEAVRVIAADATLLRVEPAGASDPAGRNGLHCRGGEGSSGEPGPRGSSE